MAKFDFSKRIASLCRQAVIEAVKKPIDLGSGRELDLDATFDDGLGSGWPTLLGHRIKKVQKTVNDDIQNERIDLERAANPARFIVNSITMHVIEKMLVKCGEYEDLTALREAILTPLHEHIEGLEL